MDSQVFEGRFGEHMFSVCRVAMLLERAGAECSTPNTWSQCYCNTHYGAYDPYLTKGHYYTSPEGYNSILGLKTHLQKTLSYHFLLYYNLLYMRQEL